MLFFAKSIWVKWPTMVKTLGGVGALAGALTLGLTRERLLLNNMFDVQSRYAEDIVCDTQTKTARTADGTCNDLSNPQMGAAYVRFGRNVPVGETHAETGVELLDPNPREISRALLTRENFQPASSLNFIAAAWIQFMTHDWFSHGENQAENPIKVPLAADDPFGDEFLEIRRSRQDPSRLPEERGRPATFQNTNTHWWDGSQIYGSNQRTLDSLRSFEGGKLSLENGGRLPTDLTGLPKTGFNDNWWLGLSLLHQLFALEHNSIAGALAAKHPDWDDQKLFDTARLVNSALMAKIHTIEWTPAILDNTALAKAMDSNWYGAVGKDLQPVANVVSEGAHTLLAPVRGLMKIILRDEPELAKLLDSNTAVQRALVGLVGSPKAVFYNVPYTLTEEFVSIYRMHSLLRDNIDLYHLESEQQFASIPLNETRNGAAEDLMSANRIDDLWYSFGVQHPGALSLHNYPQFMQQLDILFVGTIDLGTTDIVRDRERGIPRYNQFRRLVGLKPIEKFEDLTEEPQTLEKLKRLYKNDIEKIDLMVGSLAETVRPDGFGFGETTFQLFILNASRRLMTDRFFTEDYRAEVYSKEGLAWVNDNTMKSVLVRHFPQLAQKIGEQPNAFKPWK